MSSVSAADRLIGEQVRWLREAAHLTAASMAAKCGLSHESYAESEAGRRRFRARELFDVSRAFDVGISEILVVLNGDRGLASRASEGRRAAGD